MSLGFSFNSSSLTSVLVDRSSIVQCKVSASVDTHCSSCWWCLWSGLSRTFGSGSGKSLTSSNVGAKSCPLSCMESHKIPHYSWKNHQSFIQWTCPKPQTIGQQGVENHHYYQRWRRRFVIILLSAVRLCGMLHDMVKAPERGCCRWLTSGRRMSSLSPLQLVKRCVDPSPHSSPGRHHPWQPLLLQLFWSVPLARH